ncbi:stage II sporulation protein M [Haloarcula salina]|uniref:stage II sporulation protein M n=1 Tax=Haloarcula salina TaxID=1429914 RepID=UPI003C701C4A
MRAGRRLLLVSAATTVAGTVAGLLATLSSRLGVAETVGASLYALSFDPTFWGILRNNLVVFATTIVGFGVLTLANLFLTGVPLGIELVHNDHVWLFLPHGVLEFAALWTAGAAGLRIPLDVLRYFRRETDRVLTADGARMVLRYAAASLVLFVVAAAIEATITRHLAAGVG